MTAQYYTSLSVPVTVNTGSATDGTGSGVDATTSILQRESASLAGGICTWSGTWTTVTLSAGNDTTVTSGNCYRYREQLSDHVGNQGTSSNSNIAKVDTSAPSTPGLTFSGLSANAYWNSGSSTFYFRASAGGTFTVTALSTDSESAIGSYTFGTLNSNGGTNWGGSQTGDHFDYTFGASTTAPTTSRTVNSTNGAGTNSANATYSIAADATGPAVPTPTVTAQYYTSLSVPVSLGAATDTGGSGVNAGSITVQRDTIGLAAGNCGAFTSSWSTVTLSAGNDTTVTSGNCYRYREIAADNVGNSTTSGISNTAKVDTSAPSTPGLTFSGLSANAYWNSGSSTFYFRASAGGTFTVTALSTDSESAIGSYTFGTLNSNGGSNWGGSQTGDHFDYTFGASTTAPTTSRTVNSTNGAGTNSANATYSIAADATGPAVPTPTVTAQYYTSLSVPVSLGAATDTGGSGVNAGSITVQRDTIGLAAGDCGAFTSSWSTVTLSAGNDTTVTSGNCYRYREIAADNVGNSTTSGISNTAKVDNAGPTNSLSLTSGSPAGASYKSGATIYYRGAAAGSFKLTNAVTDGVSGPASSATAALGGTSTGWTHTPSTVSTPAGGPYDSNTFSWSAGTGSSPTEVVTGADAAGNTTAAGTLTFTDDSVAPSVTPPSVTAGYYTSLSIPVTKNGGTDGGSNVDATTSILQRDDIALTNGSCGSFTGSWSTVTLSGGNDTGVTNGNCYRYRELLSDNVGNQGASVASNTVKVDTSAPSAPSLAFSGLSANAYYNGSGTLYIRPSAGGTFRVTGSSTDAQSGIGSYTFGTLNSNGGSNFGGSQTGDHYDYTFGASTTAPSTARTVSATNGAGTASSDTTYSIAADTTAPSMTAPSVTAGYYTSLSVPVTKNGGTDGGSDVDNTTSVLQRDDITLTNGNCGSFAGSWSAVTLVGGNDTTVLSGHCYRYRELLSDHVGNQGTSGASGVARVDTQGPGNSLSTSSVSPAGSVYKSGATIFYRGSAAGSFKLTNAVTDGESGPASSATGALGGTSTGWSHSASTVSSPAGGPYESNAFNWNSGTTSSPTEVVTGADSAGNTTASSTLTLTNDSSAPTGGALTVNNVAATPIGPVSYDTDGSFPIDVRTDYTEPGGESGLAASTLVRTSASFSSADTCGSFGSPVTVVGSPSQSGLTTGCYMYTLTGTDNVGNTVSISTVVKVDTNNPSVSLTDPGTPLAGTVSLDASASDASTNVQQVVFERAPAGGSTWTTIGSDSSSPYSTSWSTGGVTDGLYDVRAVATDTAGNTNTSLVASRRVDNTAPNTTIDSGPADPSNDTTPDFSFSSSETGSTFQCRVDGGSWSSCTSPETISPALGEGSHTFDVRATDTAGNTDASPATSTWTIDTTAPNTTIDSSPASPSGNTTPTFTFSSSETGSTFECRLDGGTWDPCTSPDTLSPALAEGGHTFDVRATDPAGNTDGSPASHTWIIDVGPPNTTIDASPGSPSNDTTPTFTFSSSELGSTFECQLDGGGWSTCTSPLTVAPALGEGTHTFDVRATDVADNTDASPASYTWTVDLTAPNTTIDSGPANPSNDATPSFAFSATEPGSTFECRVDGGSWSACSSPDTLAALGAGSHTFDVRATDPAGNTDGTPASRTWTVDLTAPNTTINSNPADPSNNTTPDFTFSSSETGSTFECRVDGSSWTTCTSPETISPALSAGSHTFDVRATDQAGNTDGTPASYTWTVDLTAPNTTISSHPGDPSNDTTPAFSFSSSEGGSTFECRIDGGSWSACSSPDTISPALAAGSHTYDVRATDQAGNTDGTPGELHLDRRPDRAQHDHQLASVRSVE